MLLDNDVIFAILSALWPSGSSNQHLGCQRCEEKQSE